MSTVTADAPSRRDTAARTALQPPLGVPVAPRAERAAESTTGPRTGLDARRRGRLAEKLIPKALELACLVHGDGGAEAVGEFLADLKPEERDPLYVVLAGLVPVDQPVADLLSWITWDENGQPLKTPRPHKPYRRLRPVSDLQPCGTPAAYRRHRHDGEPPCDACREAERLRQADLRDRRRREQVAS